MNHAGVVRRDEPGADLLRDREHAVHGHPALAANDRRQVRSLDVRHRDVRDAVDLAEVVDADDVLVGDLAREQQLALEAPLGGHRVARIGGRLRPHDLDRHRDFERPVPGLIDRAHAAGAEQPDDVVARPEVVPGTEEALTGHLARALAPGARGWRDRRHAQLGFALRRMADGTGARTAGRTSIGPVIAPVIGPVGGRGVWPGARPVAGAIGAPHTTHTPSRGGVLLPQREQTMPEGPLDYGLKVDPSGNRPATIT